MAQLKGVDFKQEFPFKGLLEGSIVITSDISLFLSTSWNTLI